MCGTVHKWNTQPNPTELKRVPGCVVDSFALDGGQMGTKQGTVTPGILPRHVFLYQHVVHLVRKIPTFFARL